MKAATERRRRSVKLDPSDAKRFRKWVSGFDTKTDALAELGFKSMGTLDRVLMMGSGSPETIARINELLPPAQHP